MIAPKLAKATEKLRFKSQNSQKQTVSKHAVSE